MRQLVWTVIYNIRPHLNSKVHKINLKQKLWVELFRWHSLWIGLFDSSVSSLFSWAGTIGCWNGTTGFSLMWGRGWVVELITLGWYKRHWLLRLIELSTIGVLGFFHCPEVLSNVIFQFSWILHRNPIYSWFFVEKSHLQIFVTF